MKKSDSSTKCKRLSSKEKKKCKEKENTKQLDKKRSSSCSTKVEKSFDEMDLSHDIYPLANYINNKEEMVNQLFNICKGSELKDLLPSCFKNYFISDLKRVCLEQLKLLSDKWILNVLQGKATPQPQQLEVDQSDQVVSQTTSDDQNDKPTESKEKSKRSFADCGDSQQADSTSTDPPEVPLKRKLVETCQSPVVSKDSPEDPDTGTVDLDLCPNEEEVDSLMKEPITIETINEEPQATAEETPSNQTPVSSTTVTVEVGEKEWMTAFTKTQLEILELELRARAIRSLMKAQGLHNSDNEDSPRTS